MKNIKKILGMTAVMMLAVLLTVSVLPGVAQADTDVESGRIKANGKASVTATPDVAWVNLGVEKKSDTVEKAQADVTKAMNDVIASVKKAGVKESDIKTVAYNIYPNYKWIEDESRQEVTGYTVSHQLEVKIENIDNSGKILDAVVKAGGNSVSGIRFGLSNEEALYAKALEAAVKDAKAKAGAMGKGLGITEMRPVVITEQGSYYAPYMRAEANVMGDQAVETKVMSGEMEIQAEVLVEFVY